MCGIAGVIQYQSKVPRELRYRALRILFSDLMLNTESRGKDATGLYQVQTNGDWLLLKKGQRVSDFLFLESETSDDDFVYGQIMESWLEHPQELSAVIGHCRAKTVGSATDPANNHPFSIQLDKDHALLGVHNGTLSNHDRIFAKLKQLPGALERQGDVDSEAIFHFLYHMTEAGTLPITSEVLSKLALRLDGSYAVVTVNTRFPNQVVTFRETRPLEFVMISPLNVVVLASEKKFVEWSLHKYNFIRQFIDKELPDLSVEGRVLMDREYRIFDTSRNFPEGKMIYADLDKISEKGDIRKHQDKVLDDWKGTNSAYTSYSSGYQKSSSTSGGTHQASTPSTTKKTATHTGGDSLKAIPAKTGSQEKPVKVPAEVVEDSPLAEENSQGYIKAKALGLAVSYTSEREIAASIGKTEKEADDLSAVALANQIAQANFNLGYAVALQEGRADKEGVLAKARAQLENLESLKEKQGRAEGHIWESRVIIQIFLALHAAKREPEDYGLNLHNLETVLNAFPKLSEQRKQEVLDTARKILGSRDTRTLVADLKDRFAQNKRRKKREEKAHS